MMRPTVTIGSGMTVSIEYLAGNCPVQAEGSIDGVPFYFRARHEHWTLSVGGDPIGDPAWEWRERYSDDEYAAGWMSEDEARVFIAQAAEKWRAARTGGA